jgi:hypothetical protein
LTNRLNWPGDLGIDKGRDLCPVLTRPCDQWAPPRPAAER